ncbi:MAG: MarR family transcriptional regulator [Actinomycetota bacterium]|nr:MarR family transcriptional regulator [Actinomycetota bacterium]
MDARRDLARRLNAATVHLGRALRDGSPGGLAWEHQAVLTAVVFGGPVAIGELARREGVGAPAMTKTVDILERHRLVRRRSDPDDGRVVRVEATIAGKRAVLRGRDTRIVRIVTALGALDPAYRRALEAGVEALEALVAGLERPAE